MKPRHQSSVEADRSSRGSQDRGGRSEPVPDKEGEENRGRSAKKPSQIPRKGWRDILWRTKEEIKDDNLSIIAAGTGFYILLGIVPALAALISIYGLMADPGTIREQVDSMRGVMPPDVIQILDQQMTRIAQESGKASWGGSARYSAGAMERGESDQGGHDRAEYRV